MAETIIRIVFLLAVFVAVFLIAQTLARSAAEKRTFSRAVNRRMTLIQSGADRDEVVSQLLKNSPRQHPHLPPVIRGIVENFQRAVFASAIPMGMGQLAMFMTIAGLVIFAVVILVRSRRRSAEPVAPAPTASTVR